MWPGGWPKRWLAGGGQRAGRAGGGAGGAAAGGRGGAGGAGARRSFERLPAALAAATPEAVPPALAVPVAGLAEADLVRITESVVAEIAAEGRVVLVGRAAPAVLAPSAKRST